MKGYGFVPATLLPEAQARASKWSKILEEAEPGITLSIGTTRDSVIDGMAWALIAGIYSARSSMILSELLEPEDSKSLHRACIVCGAMASGSVEIESLDGGTPDAHHG